MIGEFIGALFIIACCICGLAIFFAVCQFMNLADTTLPQYVRNNYNEFIIHCIITAFCSGAVALVLYLILLNFGYINV